MIKGRTKNKRSRKPDRPFIDPKEIPLPYPIAYFEFPDKRTGYAEADSGGRFYHPAEPVTAFRINIIPGFTGYLTWNSADGWQGGVSPEDRPRVIAEIERSFSPLRYRFQLTFS